MSGSTNWTLYSKGNGFILPSINKKNVSMAIANNIDAEKSKRVNKAKELSLIKKHNHHKQ